MSGLKIPVATYRLQFNEQFRFEDACQLVPYLKQLGISDIYASPILKARKGSLHGYDVTDPTRLNPELSTEADFDTLAQTLKNHGMGLLLDIVSNHMAASPENPWWQDFMERGQESPYASFFDIDWLAFGETGSKTTGLRRFFDIGDLVGIRVEKPDVFEAVHSLILRLITEGKITGLRIDHIDGLYDPSGYLSRLQHRINPQADKTRNKAGFYVVVEKILSGNESLPEGWAVFGTTGYDFTNIVNALFVDGNGTQALDEIYSRFTGIEATFDTIIYEKKKQVINELFPDEMEALGLYLAHLAHKAGQKLQLSSEKATEVLTEVTACLPVYRTYTQNLEISSCDREYLEYAFHEVKRSACAANNAALDFLWRVFFLNFPADFSTEDKESWLQFVLRWQQLTGAIMAKGFEDTTLYTYHRLISLNEVGGTPDRNGLSVDDFHKFNLLRNKRWKHTINTTSTHDTKRSEDVRARINVLSEMSEEWESHLTRWSQWNKAKKCEVKGQLVPEPNTEIFLYQTLLGAWPLHESEVPDFKRRLKAYMVKAVREAKVFTNWIRPNKEYEDSIILFIESILEISEKSKFLHNFLQFQRRVAFYGALNSLAQVLLKITSPGVPDFYQGMELWDFSLVDPDNRRPVDFITRASMLDELIKHEAQGQEALIEKALSSWEDGQLKLYLTYKALSVRESSSDLFQNGEYIPLQVVGQKQQNLCSFARRKGNRYATVVVPRLFTRLAHVNAIPAGREVWGDDVLILPGNAPEQWSNVFTGENIKAFDGGKKLSISDILNIFPVALLVSN
ncbi:MAG: malto-oligosyltrehalose synthase [Dehalococcoidia bacterium]